MKHWSQRDAQISAVVEHARTRLPKADQENAEAFIRGMFRNAPPEDLIARPVEMLYGIALSMWKFAEKRKPGEAKIRVFNPTIEEHGWHTSHSVIQIVNDDMPFLVGSVTGNLAAAGMDVHFVLHPVLDTRRDGEGVRQPDKAQGTVVQESLMHLEIDRKTSRQVLEAVRDKVANVLADVRAAVTDWPAMATAMEQAIAGLDAGNGAVDPEEMAETKAFLSWLRDDHFTLIGYREYDYSGPEPKALRGLGILRDDERQVLRNAAGMVAVSDEIRDFMDSPSPMLVMKANVKSTIHRPVHLDYIGVKKYDENARAIGEHRFVGLFTSVAYNRRAESIPFLRRRVQWVIERAGFDPMSHDGKALLNILETFPRDELFQVPLDWLLETALGILYLRERPHPRVFLRQDKHGRFVSALVFVPREQYESNLRMRIEAILCDAFNGEMSARYAQLTDDVLARWHFIVRTRPGQVPEVDPDDIGARIAEVARGWRDHLKEVLIERWGEERGTELFEVYQHVFPHAYRDAFSADYAAVDIGKLIEMNHPDDVRFNFYRLAEDSDDTLRLKIYHASRVIPLSDCMPMLENLGLKVIEEFAYDIRYPDSERPEGCIHNFYLKEPGGHDIELSAVKAPLEETLTAVCAEACENDGFNALVLSAGLSWRQVVILRACGKFLRQLGMSYSEDYIRTTLVEQPEIARSLVALFEARFSPTIEDTERIQAVDKHRQVILEHLDGVASLDQDKILRAFLHLVDAAVRTNHYQRDEAGSPKAYLAMKIASRKLAEAPKPRPFAEIFVYSPRVEGVHLRAGPVARGGIRWSDRREDFRTEVLGLLKAQQVKNAVIVPVGAKGVFYPKRLPREGDRDAILAEGIACYRMFISGLLDLTDNRVGTQVVAPPDVVRHDGDDPYLVVAADKGTAAFSDIANEIARSYGFWLDDAFASGGSNGYDHKKMGITARGAWVSVERHFRELGINIRESEISVIGIGDMSGDVFGNGMLLSEKIKLCAAFDHRHIFIDPDPDPAASFAERKRLFAMERSSWADYDTRLISAGGGVFDRKAKSIRLSPEARARLDIEQDQLTPNELITAILKAKADLLWIGGIGTFVKASTESNHEVGDRTNDAIRINARDLRCRVVGEGGNLGLTQAARVEYARNGGAINTDSVDNSGGVNCSDREVNIKILLSALVEGGKLSRPDRDKLLEEMTAEVAGLVLEDNYLQSLAITLAVAAAGREDDAPMRLVQGLERKAGLDRDLEGLPGDDDLAERRAKGQGLTRPEIAVLIAYAKMALYDALLRDNGVEDRYLEADLVRYFPRHLGQHYREEIGQHQLRREIIATVLSNQVVNRLGPAFVLGIEEEIGAEPGDIVRAFVVVRDIFAIEALWHAIDALDNKVPTAIQTLLYLDVAEFVRRQTLWFLHRHMTGFEIGAIIKRFRPDVERLRRAPSTILGDFEHDVVAKKVAMYHEQGLDRKLARQVSVLEAYGATCDIIEVAQQLKLPVEEATEAYFYLGSVMGFNWLRNTARSVATDDHWERLAIAAIVEDLHDQQRALLHKVLSAAAKGQSAMEAARAWVDANGSLLRRTEHL
ncbi:MAG: NAD-glutamate dehydrogenase, partial [Alphaproteobacteria bacterium]